MNNATALDHAVEPLAPVDGEQPKAEKLSSAAGRVPALDGLRGIAILAVMLLHFRQYGVMDGGSTWETVYSGIVGFGWSGVNLFFVLSGFLITGILYDSRRDPHYYRVFYARRTVRIFPLYSAALAVYFIAIPYARYRSHDPDLVDSAGTAAQFCTWAYLLNWLMGVRGFTVVPALIQHFWSLSIEEQFYVVWPWVVRSLTRRRLMQVCAALAIGALASRVVLQAMHMPTAAFAWTFCRTDSMALGALIALAARDPDDWSRLRRFVWPAMVASAAGLALIVAGTGTTSTGDRWMDTAGISLTTVLSGGCLAIIVASPGNGLVSRFTASSVLRFFGKYSYALYIFHQPMAIVLRRAGMTTGHLAALLGSRAAAILAVNGVDFAVSIGLAFASWHLFEKQFLKLKELPLLRYRPS